jgi:hypothetical protein
MASPRHLDIVPEKKSYWRLPVRNGHHEKATVTQGSTSKLRKRLTTLLKIILICLTLVLASL